MNNHDKMSLSEVRKMIIRYGAKYMEQFESDLYYDCNRVGQMQPGESIFWMVSATHTHMYTAKEMHEHKLVVGLICGNRFNYRIDCTNSGCGGGVEFAMVRVGHLDIQVAVKKYQKSVVVE